MSNRALYSSIYLSIAIVCFCFTSTKAQDTIVMRNGQRYAVKNIETGDNVYFRLYNDTDRTMHGVKMKDIKYISHSDYNRMDFSNRIDTTTVKLIINNEFNFNFGTGFSNILSYRFYGYFPQPPSIYLLTPSLCLNLEYRVGKIWYLGAGLSCWYMGMHLHYYTFSYISASYDSVAFTNLTTTVLNGTGRVLLRLPVPSKSEFYIGLSAGMIMLTEGEFSGNSPIDNPLFFSYDLFVRYNRTIKSRLQLQIEAGVRNPYYIEAGLAYKFNIRRIKYR